MKLPTQIIDIISEFNGSQEELNTERGLRYMFLMTGKFFSWGLGDRDETLHRFLELYQINKCKDLVEILLKDELDWKKKEDHWASTKQVKEILCNYNNYELKNSSHQSSSTNRQAHFQDAVRNSTRDCQII